ncbi:hypothetical protein D3C87_1781420 [compost metagenome]
MPVGFTGLSLQFGRQGLRIATDHALDRQPTGNCPGTAGMIGVSVADQHHVEFFHPQFA